MTALVEEETDEVVVVNIALVAFAATTTFGGTWATVVLLLLSVTVAPPVGAGTLSVTDPCELLPPATLVGFSVRALKVTAGVTDREVVCVPPLYPAVIVELDAVVTELVVTVNVAVVAFAATTTFGGTWATVVLLLLSVTVAPPVGAGTLSVTDPCELLPPATLVGFSVRALKVTAGVTDREVVCVPPLYPAVIVELDAVVTELVVTVNVAVVAFAATTTFGGTWATVVLLLLSVTV